MTPSERGAKEAGESGWGRGDHGHGDGGQWIGRGRSRSPRAVESRWSSATKRWASKPTRRWWMREGGGGSVAEGRGGGGAGEEEDGWRGYQSHDPSHNIFVLREMDGKTRFTSTLSCYPSPIFFS